MPSDMLGSVLRQLAAPETTALSPAEEARFRMWALQNRITDVDSPQSRYDYRGYWKEHGDAPIRFGVDHFTDTYKQHGHPLFSSESKYARGKWDGGQWLGESLLQMAPAHERTRK